MKKEAFNLGALAVKTLPPFGKLLVKLLKTAKVLKGGLIAASAVSYAYIFTWQFALVIMVFLAVHEYGHVWAMKRCGIKTKGLYFIPFLGAAAVTDGEFGSCRNEVYTALMGPIWGGVLALGCCGLYVMTDAPVFAGVATWMFFVTLFNLLPIMPLDGGRVLRCIGLSIHSWGGVAMFVLGIGLAALMSHFLSVGLVLFFVIIGGIEVIGEAYLTRDRKKDIEKLNAELKELGVTATFPMKDRENITLDGTAMGNWIFNQMVKDDSLDPELVPKYYKRHRDEAAKQLSKLSRLVSKDKPPRETLTRKGILWSALALAAVAAVSLGAMVAMQSVPGAELALNILKDK